MRDYTQIYPSIIINTRNDVVVCSFFFDKRWLNPNGKVLLLHLPLLHVAVTKNLFLTMEDEKKRYESYVIVHNIAKRHNVGTLARSCTAFGVSELILVGRRDFNAFGSHGSTSHLRFRHFHSLSEAKSFLKVRFAFP